MNKLKVETKMTINGKAVILVNRVKDVRVFIEELDSSIGYIVIKDEVIGKLTCEGNHSYGWIENFEEVK